MQCHAVHCNAMQCNALQCNAVHCRCTGALHCIYAMAYMHWCIAYMQWHICTGALHCIYAMVHCIAYFCNKQCSALHLLHLQCIASAMHFRCNAMQCNAMQYGAIPIPIPIPIPIQCRAAPRLPAGGYVVVAKGVYSIPTSPPRRLT